MTDKTNIHAVLDWDDNTGTYSEYREIELNGQFITFYLAISITGQTTFGDYDNPPEFNVEEEYIHVSDISVYDKDGDAVDFDYDETKKLLLELITWE